MTNWPTQSTLRVSPSVKLGNKVSYRVSFYYSWHFEKANNLFPNNSLGP